MQGRLFALRAQVFAQARIEGGLFQTREPQRLFHRHVPFAEFFRHGGKAGRGWLQRPAEAHAPPAGGGDALLLAGADVLALLLRHVR